MLPHRLTACSCSICSCSVCVTVCLSVCPRRYLRNHAWYLPNFCACCLWLWHDPPPASLRYVTYVRFCGRCDCTVRAKSDIYDCFVENVINYWLILSFMLPLIPLTKYVTVLCGRLFHVLNTRYPTHWTNVDRIYKLQFKQGNRRYQTSPAVCNHTGSNLPKLYILPLPKSH